MAGTTQRVAFLAAHADAALVSAEMPLRANLSVLDNIALIPEYRDNVPYDAAADATWQLLLMAGIEDCAFKRDPDLDSAQRFAAKLLRAAIARPPIIMIDRPGLLLPDQHHPSHVAALLARLGEHLNTCWIVDYAWNRPLYPHP